MFEKFMKMQGISGRCTCGPQLAGLNLAARALQCLTRGVNKYGSCDMNIEEKMCICTRCGAN